ncbi:hypothetical protein JRQ81_005352 [Phrynocephalus forsythii]|uniref:small monomeric GTPase n=1 Tax=Phrynocephalus forsythii TaxID=171643 RepID=A0A9Q0XG76_9SAUR|nr:hypothetical protein JRQ81_005352 [Phrynocephalus forsythii]
MVRPGRTARRGSAAIRTLPPARPGGCCDSSPSTADPEVVLTILKTTGATNGVARESLASDVPTRSVYSVVTKHVQSVALAPRRAPERMAPDLKVGASGSDVGGGALIFLPLDPGLIMAGENIVSLPTLKLLLVGDSAVGKSSLLLRFTENQFHPYLNPTIGVDFKVKKMMIGDLVLQLAIWDTAGQERFRTLTPSYYRGAQGVILVYDVTRRETFLSLESWLQELEMYTKKKAVKMLVGNKIDESDREVERREGLEFARKHSMLFVEASAKMQDGVQEAFKEVVARILQTPELWHVRKEGVKLAENHGLKEADACSGAYCSLV